MSVPLATRVSCVAVDYGGTLTLQPSHITGQLVARVLAEQFAVTVPDEFPAVFDLLYRGQPAETLRAAATRTGTVLPADPGKVAEAVQQETTERPVDPRAARAVTVLHQRGFRLLLAANTPRGHVERCATLARAGILDCFADIVLSSTLGAEKPDSRFYRATLRAAGCRAAHVVFVGDRLVTDVLGPLAHGMRAVLVDRHGHAEEAPEGVPVVGHLAEVPRLLDNETKGALR